MNKKLLLIIPAVLAALAFIPQLNGLGLMDDAYIFYRYANNLLETGEWAWNPGFGPSYGTTSVFYLGIVTPILAIFRENPALTMFLSSLIPGIIFFVLLAKMAAAQSTPENRFQVIFLLLLTLLTASPALAANFTTGMDTMFVLAYLTLYYIGFQSFLKNPSWRNFAIWGIAGSLAFFVRPDLYCFTAGIPFFAALALPSKELKRRIWGFCALILVPLPIWFNLAEFTFGSALPLSFFAKGAGLYGDEIRELYRGIAFSELLRFAMNVWPLLLLISAGYFFRIKNKSARPTPMALGILAGSIFFTLYYAFFVVQIMGFHQRFYMPLLPGFIYLAIHEGTYLMDEWRAGNIILNTPLKAVGLVIAGALLMGSLYRSGKGQLKGYAKLKNYKGISWFDAKQIYQSELHDYWVALDRFSQLPDDLVIATTEVGMPAALNPKKVIVDLAGLNEPTFALEGFSTGYLFYHYSPDLIYLPHPDYRTIYDEIIASPRFNSGYELHEAGQIGGAFGFAISRKSPYYAELHDIAVSQ